MNIKSFIFLDSEVVFVVIYLFLKEKNLVLINFILYFEFIYLIFF